VNTIQNKLASLKLATRWCGSCRQLLLAGAVFLLAGSGAYAADGSFAAPFPIGGAWGTYTADNSNSFPAVGTPNIAGNPPVAPVWFQFTATNDGEVTIDTIGSLDSFGLQMDTVLEVYGGTNLANLYQVAANDDLYPSVPLQLNYANQNTYAKDTNSGAVTASSQMYSFFQPFSGPSDLRFTAKRGVTYYIAVDSVAGDTGTIALNWAYHSSGVFRFASENVEETGITDTNGNPILLYQAAASQGSVLLTVTRVAGYSGRMTVDYATADGDPNMLSNGDLPGVAGSDYTAATGTLTFDDFEMSKTIAIAVKASVAGAAPNHDFTVVLSNPQTDSNESPDVSAPRVDPVFGQALVRVLNMYSSPGGAVAVVNTNGPVPVTNYVTLDAFNFGSANFRVQRPHSTNSLITYTFYVNRLGINNNATNIYYQVDSGYPFYNTLPNKTHSFDTFQNILFPLQPGSEYATPDPAGSGQILDTTPDFTFMNGVYSGTISWADKDRNPKPLSFTTYDTGQPNFNKDFHVELYAKDSNGNIIAQDVGMVSETTITILYQDQNPPAGSVDEKFNADYNLDLSNMQIPTKPTEMSHPGTDGQIFGVAVQPDNKTIIVGDFFAYNGFSRNCIARVNTDGSLDTSFTPGTGVGAVPGISDPTIFINAVTLDATNNKVLIAGNFTSYNGTARGNVARLNSDGTLDTTFYPGAGANGTVYAILLQSDGKIMIGGDFTSYNGYAITNIARLNTDGSLDTSFNPAGALNATVYTLAEQGGTFINASRSASGADTEDDNLVNVGATSGVLTVDYDMLAVPDDMKVFYGNTNGVLIYDTGEVSGTGHLVIPFSPTNGLTSKTIEIVMNQGNGTPGTVWFYTASVQSSYANQVYAGGDFTSVGGHSRQDHIARLLADGSVDTTFDPNAGINGPVYALAVQPDGKVIAGGEFSAVNNLPSTRLVRLTTDGLIDTNFYCGSGVDGTVLNLNLPGDGTIYVGGAFTAINGTHRLGFGRLNNDGTVDTSFLDAAYNQFAGLPREHFNDSLGAVYSSGVQSDGGVIIGGSFSQVGGGQYNSKVRPESNANAYHEIYERDGIRNRSNFARLIGGGTPGPGNIGLLENSYSVNKSGSFLSPSLLRTNGNLGYASANFSVQPIVAQSGVDFSYSSSSPTYPLRWENYYPYFSRMHSDGLYGTNDYLASIGGYVESPAAQVYVSVLNSHASSGDVSSQLQLANPANADQFYLGGQNIPLGVGLGMATAPMTIVDDQHQSGVVGFASASYSYGSSTAGNAPVGVIRTNGSSLEVDVNYTTLTNGSTAIQGSDYNFSSGILKLVDGVTSNNFNVAVKITNYVGTVDKFINLKLYNLQSQANGVATLGLTNAVLHIINPNFAGYLQFSTNSYNVSLNGNYAYVTVNRIVGSKGTLTAKVVTADGTAINGVNYTGGTNLLQWNNGDVSPRIIAVPLINNGNLGGSLAFSVSLVNPTLNGTNNLALLGPTSAATVTINNDNNYGTYQFSASDYTVNENGGYATLTVTRTGSWLGAADVDYATADATATDGLNYTGTSDTIHFDAGQTTQEITIPILNDGVADNLAPADFYFQVTLSLNSAGTTLGTPVTAKVHLVDAQAFNVPPGAVDVTFNADPGINGPVFALAQQSNGQLIAGGSFSTVNGTALNNLARLNADGTTDTAGFLYNLAGANGAVYALVNQADDRILLGGQFTTVDGVVRNRVARVLTDGSLDTSFNPGTGPDGAVYALADTYANGSHKIYLAGAFATINTANLPFLARLNDNGQVDRSFNPGFGPNATVYAVAAYPTNSPFAGKVLIGGAFTNVNNVGVSYLARLNADGSVDTNFNYYGVGVDGTVRTIAIQNDGEILVGGDFNNAFDFFDNVPAAHIARIFDDSGSGFVDTDFASSLGSGPNGRVDAITLQADNRIVIAGEFTQANGVTRNNITRLNEDGSVDPTINFGDGANGAVYAALVQKADQNLVLGGTFTLFNDQAHDHIVRIYGGSTTDAGNFEFTSASYQIAENGLDAQITIRRTGGTSGTNSVDFSTTGVTAVPGVNYQDVARTVIFPPGEVIETVAVPVLDDGVITPDLTVNLGIANAGPAAGLGDQTNAVLTIQNVETAVAFATPTYFVSKYTLTGRATLDVIRLGSTNGVAAVNFITTTNGTAVPGVDFVPTNLTLTFNSGVSDLQVQIPILTNGPALGDKTVVFALSNAVNTLIYNPSVTTLTIHGTNGPGVIGFATNSVVVGEGDGNAYFTVIRTNGSSGIAAVNYTTVIGTAVPGLNYVTTFGTLTFGDGETNRTITVPLIDNNLVQGIVNFSVVLTGVNGASLSAATNVAVAIVDNDAAIEFAAATNTIPENSGYVSVIITRLYNTNAVVSANYTTVDGTALAGVNYTASSGTLTFTNGEVLKSLTIPVLDDTNVTGDLNFGVSLSNPVGAQLLAPSNTVVVVQDADAGVSFDTNTQRVLKSIGQATITVVCSNPRVEPVIYSSNTIPLQVNYSTADGTALAGSDYQAVSGTLIFTNGLATNTFTVPIYNSGTVTGDKAFSVILTNVTAPGQITPYRTQSVVIAESNSGLRFSQGNYQVFKNGVSATINVFRTGYTDSVVSVNYLATNGTAIGGVNFVPTSGVLVFPNGVTSQNFNVTLIANNVVQPNLSVLLQLSNPTNGLLVAPSAATLTILENGGSYVIPAGSQMVTNYTSHLPDGIIYSNNTVQVLFALRDSAGLNVTNLFATLLATNGVTPVGYATTNYGPLTVYGHSVSQPFTFKASGANSFPITPTFALYDNAKFIGTAEFPYTIGTWATSFASTNAIIINDNTNASPYPSVINVSGIGGTLVKATVTFTNLSHTSPSDIDALVVSPVQKNTLVMAHAGSQYAVNHLTITLDDAATNSLPQNSVITNGVYKPTSYGHVRNFP
jgi:uncharacterized delta-60 repeat protein